MPENTRIVNTYHVVDGSNDILNGEMLLRAGYDSPWPNARWEPNELFITAGCFQQGETVQLEMSSTRWESYPEQPEGVRPRVTTIESEVVLRTWRLEGTIWKEIT